VLALDSIAPTLLRMVGTSATVPATNPRSRRSLDAIELEASLDRLGSTDPATMDRLGRQVQLSCPDCSGPMWDVGDEHQRRYRCYLGHVATAREILDQGREQVETALWSAVRALRDRASTYDTMAEDALRTDQKLAHELYRQRAREAMDQAELARRFLLDVIDNADASA
jgi:two-component system chemotaxis response regulator CheB